MSSSTSVEHIKGTHPKSGKLFLMTYVPKDGSLDNHTTHQHKTMLRPETWEEAEASARSAFPEILPENKVKFSTVDWPWMKESQSHQYIHRKGWGEASWHFNDHVWSVLVTQHPHKQDRGKDVDSPEDAIYLLFVNNQDSRPPNAHLKDQDQYMDRVFKRASTVGEIYSAVCATYRVPRGSFSLMINPLAQTMRLSSIYLMEWDYNQPIGHYFTGRNVNLGLQWRQEYFHSYYTPR